MGGSFWSQKACPFCGGAHIFAYGNRFRAGFAGINDKLKLIGPSKALTGCYNSMFISHRSQCNDFHNKGLIQVLRYAHGAMWMSDISNSDLETIKMMYKAL